MVKLMNDKYQNKYKVIGHSSILGKILINKVSI